MAVLLNFPDSIVVTIGAGWKNPFPNDETPPFLEDDEITLVKVTGSNISDHAIDGDVEWWEEYQFYSEDGTETLSATNRIIMEYWGYQEIDYSIEYAYALKSVDIKPHHIYAYEPPVLSFEILHEYEPVSEIPEESFFNFKDIYLMESRFGMTTFWSYLIHPTYYDCIDDTGFTENEYYNNMLFKTLDAAAPAVPMQKVFKGLNNLYPERLKNFIGRSALGTEKLLKSSYGFGTQLFTIKSGGMGLSTIMRCLNNLGVFSQKIQKILGTISGNETQKTYKGFSSIEEKDLIQKHFLGMTIMDDIVTNISFLSTAYEVYIDGYPMKNFITSMQIKMSDSEVHNSLSFTSFDFKLYQRCNPNTNKGETRIEVHVGTRIFYFLIEERTGSYSGFTCWGRSPSAKIDSPYVSESDYAIVEAEKASSVSETIADDVSVTWQSEDWVLPPTFNFKGLPIEAIVEIVKSIEAICRSDDTGNLIVRDRYPIRPVNINSAVPVLTYDNESNLIELSVKENLGTKENKIEVQGITEDVEIPQLELEESPTGQYEKGKDILVRAYWGTNSPPEITEYYTTDGSVRKVSSSKTVTRTETIVFSDGQARTNYPISRLRSYKWVGKSGGTINWKKFSNELYIENTKSFIVSVTYESTYQTYRLYGHDVSMLIFVMVINSQYDIAVQVKMGDADTEAPALSKPLLTNHSTAVKAGTSYLDDKKYDTVEISFTAPYNDLAKDGIVVSLEDPNLQVSGKCHVKECTIDFDGAKVTNNITALQFKN